MVVLTKFQIIHVNISPRVASKRRLNLGYWMNSSIIYDSICSLIHMKCPLKSHQSGIKCHMTLNIIFRVLNLQKLTYKFLPQTCLRIRVSWVQFLFIWSVNYCKHTFVLNPLPTCYNIWRLWYMAGSLRSQPLPWAGWPYNQDWISHKSLTTLSEIVQNCLELVLLLT